MNKKSILIGVSILVVLLFFGAFSFRIGPVELKGTQGNLPASYSSTTQYALTTGVTLIAATSTNCAARIITTGANGIGLSIGTALSGVAGAVGSSALGLSQAASTTTVYPAENFGCGPVRARGIANTDITIVETSQ